MPRSHKIIFGIFVCIHVFTALWLGLARPGSISPIADPLEYRLLALHLFEGVFSIAPASEQESELLRTPGYPLLVAATYMVDGGWGLVIVLLQQFLLAVVAYLIYRLVIRVTQNQTLALVSLTVFLIEPQQWLFSLQTMTETFSVFLMTVSVWLALQTEQQGWRSTVVWEGILVGCMVLVKPGLMILVPFVLLLCVVRMVSWRTRLIYIGTSVVVALIIVSPWLIRNTLLTGVPIISSSAVFNFIGLGAPEDTTLLLRDGRILYDNAGHHVMENRNYTVKSYPNLVLMKKKIIEHEGVWRLVEKQISCALPIWLNHNIGSVLSVVHVPFVNTSGITIAVMLEKVVWIVLLFFVILGILRGIIDPSTRYTFLLFGCMLGTLTFLNVCTASSRMLIPLYAPILLCASMALASFQPFRPNIHHSR